jgi:hypothetical protein
MSIYNYKNFQLLLEAKIYFFKNLKRILKKMDHPLAKKILELEDKDLDININYFNTKNKSYDYLSFYQDSKVRGWEYMITDNAGVLFLPKLELGDDINLFVNSGDIGTIESDVDLELIKKHYPRYDFERVVILKTKNGKHLIDFNFLKPVKPSGYEEEGKVGRTFNTLLKSAGYNPTPKEIEDLVNNYKKVVSDKYSNFELVSGEDIRKFYLGKNSSSLKKGTLGGSCMRYEYCQNYFGIYINNKNVQCLVLNSDDEPGKIMARALVWKLKNGKYFMDRVYSTHDYEVGLFIDYAKERGWIYKSSQNSLSTGFMLGDDNYTEPLIVQLENIEFDEYPYLDTLKWMDYSKKTLSNINNGTLPLESTEGFMGVGCDFCLGEGQVECPECYGRSGNRECPICIGSGMADCPECS